MGLHDGRQKAGEQAGWDRELLSLELADLSEPGFDVGEIAFEGEELGELLNFGQADPREEEIPPIPDVPVSQPGDRWVLGSHPLLCGDATSAGVSNACWMGSLSRAGAG